MYYVGQVGDGGRERERERVLCILSEEKTNNQNERRHIYAEERSIFWTVVSLTLRRVSRVVLNRSRTIGHEDP